MRLVGHAVNNRQSRSARLAPVPRFQNLATVHGQKKAKRLANEAHPEAMASSQPAEALSYMPMI